MPFPPSGAARPAPAFTPPSAPAPPQAPVGGPPAPPGPPPAAAEPQFWVAVNGQTTQMGLSALRQQIPSAPAMSFDQTSGWVTVGHFTAQTSAPAAAPAGGFAGRAAAPAQQQGSTPQNLYAGVENAQVYDRSSYFTNGDYIFKVTSAEYKTGRVKNMVIIEGTVLTSSYDPNIPATHAALREGTHAAIFIQKNDNFLSNIKEVILAVSGFDAAGVWRDRDDVVTAAECAALTAPEQAYAGAVVYLEARDVKTKTGGEYTRISWWPCPLKPDGTPDTVKLFAQVRI